MLAAAIAVSTSGCSIIAGELGKEKHKQLMLSLLNEKYGEEFVIHNFETKNSGGGGNGVPNLDYLFDFSGRFISYHAICSPKANEEIIFEASIATNGSKVNEEYPHAVIKHLIKEEVEMAISKYSDNYAVYVYMSKPKSMHNDTKTQEYLESVVPFTKASDISIKSYNEKYLQTYLASIDIVLCDEKYKSVEATQKILDDNFKSSLYEMTTYFDFYFTSKDKVDKIKETLKKSGITPDSQYDKDIKAMNTKLEFHYNNETEYNFVYKEKYSKLG